MPPDAPSSDLVGALAHPGQPLLQRLAGDRVDAEGGEQLADDGVGLHLAAFQRIDVRTDLFVYEFPYGVAHSDIDIRPFEHGDSLGRRASAARRA